MILLARIFDVSEGSISLSNSDSITVFALSGVSKYSVGVPVRYPIYRNNAMYSTISWFLSQQ